MAELVVESGSPELLSEVLEFCHLAFGEDLTELYATLGPRTHVLVRDEGAIVSHAMWVTRWLQVGDGPLLETAYVEAVASHPEFRRRGLASQVMRRLVSEIPSSFELAALCPATSNIYELLGWRFWVGRLSIRLPSGELLETPEERVMVYDLEGRPRLDGRAPLSAEWRAGELW